MSTVPERPRASVLIWRVVLRNSKLLLVAYCLVTVLVAVLQRALIYHPERVREVSAKELGWVDGLVVPVRVAAADNVLLHGWHVLPPGRSAKNVGESDRELKLGRPVVLFFSGNGGDRGGRSEWFEVLSECGCDVFAFDYRGYAENDGSPSEAAFAADAQAIWKYLTTERGIAADRMVLFGESLGGGVAIRLASEMCEAKSPPRGLIVRSTFTSMVDAGSYHYPWLPVGLVLVDRYPSIERISKLTCPLIVMHGRRDTTVPFEQGRRLFDAAPAHAPNGFANRFIELPKSDHNDVPTTEPSLVRRAISEFVIEIGKR
jgi:pimeloyl-ACP methyl ester carboxylesterase